MNRQKKNGTDILEPLNTIFWSHFCRYIGAIKKYRYLRAIPKNWPNFKEYKEFYPLKTYNPPYLKPFKQWLVGWLVEWLFYFPQSKTPKAINRDSLPGLFTGFISPKAKPPKQNPQSNKPDKLIN